MIMKNYNMVSFNGIFPPLPTAFDENQELSADKIRSNIRILSRHSLSGFLILGSNGELVMLSENEKIAAYEAAREAIPENKLMLAGTGGESTRETIRLTREAARAGADAALVLNPFYYKGLMTKETLVAHYHDVAEAAEIPVLIYNMPANSGIDMTAEIILEIASHENIVGLKDSGGNLAKTGQIAYLAKPNFQLLAGSAGFLLPALSMGATGGILALANIAPAQCITIYEKFQQGKLDEARILQQKMIRLNTAVTRQWGVPALKAAMDMLGLYGGPARKPIQPVTSKTRDDLRQLLATADIQSLAGNV
ncbi:MAG: dihydrodipicolinate synthase family protein [Bacteroidales bacterium]